MLEYFWYFLTLTFYRIVVAMFATSISFLRNNSHQLDDCADSTGRASQHEVI